jgi:Vacuolar sorting protein 39 domain 1
LEKTAQADLDSRIRLAYGRHLLSQQRYEEAMLNLGMSSYCDPLEILRSFPFLIPEALAQKTALGTSDLAQSPSTEAEKSKIVAILTPYLLSYRSRLAAVAVEGGSTATAAHGFGSQSIGSLIDTALLNAFLLLPDNGALLQFIQRANEVDLEAGSKALEKAGRYAELVALYKAHNRHAAALEVLETLILRPDTLQVAPKGAAIELTGLPGVWAAIQYLSSHEPRDFSLISSHAK